MSFVDLMPPEVLVYRVKLVRYVPHAEVISFEDLIPSDE